MVEDSFKITHIESIADGIYDLTIECPAIAKTSAPGQFVHIKCDGLSLRRPISICGINKESGTIRLVFQAKGKGTEWISNRKQGDFINVLGPLGNGFDLDGAKESAIVIGGGIGVPPMLGISAVLKDKTSAIIGFRNSGAVILEEDFKEFGTNVSVCTDDGSYGTHGFVSDVLIEKLKTEKPSIIYACGPMQMLRVIAKIANEHDIRCQVSLEERMGCGVGACLGCACKIIVDGKETYKHVCKDGPVFEAKEVVFGG
ncbi:MAG: dihydroorotate dehydrogenase electron transfer subunit [Eubacteriales bacterium]|nr:dihydroorotate dehydrogenase electron transfer subunit [Eubacteriales bacterium]